MRIRVLNIIARIGKESFGLGQVAVNLVKAQNDLKADAQIWCLDTEDQISWAIEQARLDRSKVKAFPKFGPAILRFSRAMLSAAKSDGGNFNVVHQHGIWTACSLVSNALRRAHAIPVVVAPHGSLQKWALRHSTWNKRLAMLGYEQENLNRAACLHATSEAEVADFRECGLQNPIAVIPNGVSETWLESRGDGIRFRTQYAIPTDRRLLLFLSRITPKKGLALLLEAIDRIRDSFTGWILLIAGSDEFDYLKKVKALVEKLKLQNNVRFLGPLYDQTKRDAFAASDAFVLPSYSEGAPMVVLDSLANGVPVITTHGTPWQSLLTWKCGWWVDISIDGIAEALKCMVSLSTVQLQAMGQRGLELVKSQYLWRNHAQKTLNLYDWLLGHGAKPDFVIID